MCLLANANYCDDTRIVLTLDAGGTSFRFSATRGGRTIIATSPAPAHGNDLDLCLAGIVGGFKQVIASCPARPVAISFAFPGPADYPSGIIGDLPNLPAFRGGVALGALLEDTFGLPVCINNDGRLFAYGEAIGGLLPWANGLLRESGSAKRYRNLLGVTFGTGFGGGIVMDGHLHEGDTSSAGNVWLLRNRLFPDCSAEESVSIRAIRGNYAAEAGIAFEQSPDPKIIAQIARGEAPGDKAAAVEAYRRLGTVAGDALAQALTLVDGLVVIGGGLSKAFDLFMPALVSAVNDVYALKGGTMRRLCPHVFNLEDAVQREGFCRGKRIEIVIPRSGRKVPYDSLACTGVGLSRLGTSEAIALGAYACALRMLDGGKAT